MRKLGILAATTTVAATAAHDVLLAQGRQPQPRPAAPPAVRQQPAPAHSAETQPPKSAEPQQPKPPQVPFRTEILRFDNWTLTCNEFSEGPKKRICSAQLNVTQEKSNNVLLSWTFALDGENRPVSVIQTPTGVSIGPGVQLRLGKAVRKMPFVSCEPQRCTASIPVDNSLIRDIGGTADADVIIYAPNGSGVKFNFPLKGFDKAYAELAR
ncbi:MAG TPA: invasion associated locus B family protein [Xanthobacteraceae bacterium]|nr:invasion associated locus B family protein [Xanthobacteraceae bacterium]